MLPSIQDKHLYTDEATYKFKGGNKMYVQICWKTEKTEEGKVHVTKRMTVKEALKMYKEKIEPLAIDAYLRHFDGWHHHVYRRLKTEGNSK